MTSEHVPASLQRRVRERARDRCEYCGIAQALHEATFHIDHVVPRVLGGETSLKNLALACVSCSLRKGPRRTAVDPESTAEVSLFNPRTQVWSEHLRLIDDGQLVGLTACGRATLTLLKMNRPPAVFLRRGPT